MPSKHFIDDRSSFVDAPPPSLAVASPLLPGASKGGHYIGTYGRPPMSPLRRPAKARARRSLIVASIRLIQRFAQARRRTRAAIQKANSKARRCAISLGGAVICYFAAPPPPSATGPLPGALLGAPPLRCHLAVWPGCLLVENETWKKTARRLSLPLLRPQEQGQYGHGYGRCLRVLRPPPGPPISAARCPGATTSAPGGLPPPPFPWVPPLP